MKKKIISIIVALVLVFAFATSALAVSNDDFGYVDVYGGPSRVYFSGKKEEPNSMDMNITYLVLNGQEDLMFRGYGYNTDSGDWYTCTYAKEIYRCDYRTATYTTHPYTAYLKMSILSSDYEDFATIRGGYYI